MKVILFGGTGMVGSGVLLECLEDDGVEEVLSVGRRPLGREHAKIRELNRSDLFRLTEDDAPWGDYDACFFCLGASSAGMKEERYIRVTHTLTMHVARLLETARPGMVFCFVSGEGTDSREESRFLWARVKGQAENDLLASSLDTYCFRPGFVLPKKGVRSSTGLYQTIYTLTKPLHPVFQRAFAKHVTTSEEIGRAMLTVVRRGADRRHLENRDISRLGQVG
jgi:nucleoside-diphosphate-sugar epimerase